MANWYSAHSGYDARDQNGNRTGARPKVGQATGAKLRDAVQAATAPQGRPTPSPQPKTQASQDQAIGDSTGSDFARGVKELANPGQRPAEIDQAVDAASK
jgi:hypothetical protein